MPRNQSLKVYNTFVAGLVTEATPLTFPENAVLGADNCVFDKKGDIRRRLGLDYEASAALTNLDVVEATWETQAVGSWVWEEVGGDGTLHFLVVQIDATLHFYDLSTQPISDNKKGFTVNLASFAAPAATDVGSELIDVAFGKGYLFVVSSKLKPFYIEYTPTGSGSIVNTEIGVLVRDFDGVEDSLDIDEEPTSLTDAHNYNLKNQGWISSGGGVANPITTYFSSQSKYPGNNKQWWVAKDASDNFDPSELTKIFFGNTRAPRGHFILDPFNKDRTTISGVSNIVAETVTTRPEAVAFFAGRAWYGGPTSSTLAGTVYFSQIIENDTNIGRCYQEADPTSEEISDLIDTDGGVIVIPQAGNILSMRVTGESLLVFAVNGVWAISGSGAGFSPTDYTVTSIGDAGLLGKRSIVDVEGTPLWWSERGIFSIGRNEVTDRIEAKSVSEQTIQTYYDDTIPNVSKTSCQGSYDPVSKKVTWLWNAAGNTGSYQYKYDKALVFDTNIGGFYPFSFGSLASNTPYAFGVFVLPTVSKTSQTNQIIQTSTGNNVIQTSTGNNVVADVEVLRSATNTTAFVIAKPDGTVSEFTFGQLNNDTFYDWATVDGTGVDAPSFFETGYLLEGNVTNARQAPHVMVYCKRTETGYQSDGGSGFNVLNPSSCFMQARWDFSDNSNSGKFSTRQQVYRILKTYNPTPAALDFNSGYPVTVTRNKVRGTGKALHLYFDSQAGFDFDMFGWAIQFADNVRV
jgi:hypothetical protein